MPAGDAHDQTLEVAPHDRVEAAARFAAGTTLGHFRIIGELGSGGMGVVFEAHDPDLDRRVAIKVVRGHEPGSAAGVRLVHEAQAMARLSHPNVVAVHEVGTIDDQVFVVMELVRGETLASWLEAERTWRDIVYAFVQAGEGLLAAHHAGLVHRDFKPSNVLIDRAGRVRVGDFGLAHGDDDGGPRLARGSGAAGTPAFMAPEQRDGAAVDARADQYAFAMSLRHALDAEHTLGRAPRRVQSAIARALSIDPAGRFASLDVMLDELRTALRARRRLVVATAAAVAISIGPIVWWTQQRQVDHCAEGAGLVNEVWGSGDRAALVARFLELRPGASVAIASAAGIVDDWAESWKLGRRAGCAVAEPQRIARLACLDQGLHDLRAQVAVWRTADAGAVDRVVATATALPAPSACASAGKTPPLVPVIAERVAQVHALVRTGRAPEAKARVASLLPLVEVIDNPAATAAALHASARVAHANGELASARDQLARAASAAGRAGADALLIDLLLFQSLVVTDQGRPLDSLGLLDAANALIARAGSEGTGRWHERYTRMRGDALALAGRLPEAIDELRRGVALLEARAAREPSARPELSMALGALAGAYNQGFEYARAHDLLVRALELDETAYGPMHPEVGKTLHDLATNESRLGRNADAVARLERARAIFVATYGEQHYLVGGSEVSLATTALEIGELDLARTHYARAKAILTAVLPANHPHLGLIEEGLGSIEREVDRCAKAIPHFERALAILDHIGREGVQRGMLMINLGACISDVGRHAEAYEMLHRALAELERVKVEDKQKSEAWALLAELEWRKGEKAKAIALARQILAVTSDDDGPAFQALRAYVREEQLAVWTR